MATAVLLDIVDQIWLLDKSTAQAGPQLIHIFVMFDAWSKKRELDTNQASGFHGLLESLQLQQLQGPEESKATLFTSLWQILTVP